jgi:hypothetical protein
MCDGEARLELLRAAWRLGYDCGRADERAGMFGDDGGWLPANVFPIGASRQPRRASTLQSKAEA